MSLADALERAASELAAHEDAVRDANGDPDRLLETLGEAGAGTVLVWMLENEVDAGEELALAWTESEAGVGPLQAVDSKALKKPGRKALRKALHRLRSRGVDVKGGEEAPTVAHVGAVADSFDRALVSPVDPRGTRMAYLVEPHPAGGARMYEAVLDDAHGIIDFRVYSAGRSKVRTFLKDVGARSTTPMFDVEPAELRALIARTAKRQRSDNPLPRAFIEHRSQLKLDPAASTPGDRAVAHFAAVSASAEQLEALAERARLGVIGPWPPNFTLLRTLGEEVKAHLDGLGDKAALSGEKQDPATRAILAKAADELYAGEFGVVTAQRLRESAFVLWQRGQEGDARSCLAAATVFEKGEGAGQNPVALAFLEVLIAPLVAQAAGAELEEETEISESGAESSLDSRDAD